MLAFWNSIGLTGQTGIAAGLIGIVAWLIQRAVTLWPGITWLTPLSGKWAQIGVATIIPVLTGIIAGLTTGDWKQILVALFAALGASQIAHNAARPATT